MVNKVWASFIIIGVIVCVFTNRIDSLNTTILNSTKSAFDLVIKMFPVMALWMGISKIAEVSGLLKKMSLKLSKFLKYIFPEIPKGHESISYISSNMIANMFGLGSAATPFGLKAMQSLQELNNKKDTASRSMITFLILNTGSITLIPTTIISLRIMYNSLAPTSIIVPCIIATGTSLVFGLIIDKILAKRSYK